MPPTFTVETLSRQSQHYVMMAKAVLEAQPESEMPSKKAARFPRTSRLLRHADFERVYKQGRRHFSASMTVFYWPRPLEDENQAKARVVAPTPQGLRVGFTVGRTLGGAVERNRMKRRLREAVRLSQPFGGVAADIVINPKKSLLTTDFASILNEVNRAFAVIEQKLSPKTTVNAPDKITGSRESGAGSRF